jgi:peptide/nickel transport system substrate-binding protein
LKPTRLAGIALGLVVAAFLAYFWVAERRLSEPAEVVDVGGRLVATFRTEPSTFNRFVSPNAAEDLVTRLTQATLVRFNRLTHELEPRLASEWSASPDGLTWTLQLRDDATFSDGTPFTSADVLFTFQVLYDPTVRSEMASGFLIDGQPIAARALDEHTVVIIFPAPYGPGISLLDSLPILPRHKLEDALSSGSFREAWNVETPLDDIVGLGPFTITEYVAGERLVFERNPQFWRTDDAGRPLPYLDAIELQIVPEQNAEMLLLEAGDVDVTTAEIRAEDVAAFRRLEDEGRIQLMNAGVTISPDALWFNLAPEAAVAAERPWLQREEFRHAVSLAVDRQALVDTVYLGAAEAIFGPVTPGHGDWYLADLPRPAPDPDAARALLASIGLEDRDSDGFLEDTAGEPAQFSIMTARGLTTRERAVAVIQEQLRQVGLAVEVASLEVSSMIERWGQRDYDAMYFYFPSDSADPASSLDFWLSSGGFHVWNAGQATPATEWEAAIDDLMQRQMVSPDPAERRRLFADAQRTLAEHLPILNFAAPHVTLAASARVAGAQPSVIQPSILWNAEVLSLRPPG